MKIILASKSPRRKELLAKLDIPFDTVVSQVDEAKYFDPDPIKFVETLSLKKAEDIKRLQSTDSIIIGCDTVVVFDNKILGKPKDEQEAFQYLKMLTGKKHLVYSGIALVNTRTGDQYVTHDCTEVYMRELDDRDIKAYIATKEPLDKAGAYGIQGIGSILVERIIGDFYTVMGLPIQKLYIGLKQLGVNYFDLIKEF